jgi:putative flippase GtrA
MRIRDRQAAPSVDRRLVFIAVGTMGLAVQLVVLRLLATGTGLDLQSSTALAVEAALLHNFVWHERWTWADRTGGVRPAVLQRLARFHLTSGAVSIAGNLALTTVFVAVAGLHYLAANVLAVAACTVLNFVTADRLVFHAQGAPMTRRRPAAFVGVFAACVAITPPPAAAAQPQPDTVAAWNTYVQSTEQRIAREVSAAGGLLMQDVAPARDRTDDARRAGGPGIVKMATLDATGRAIVVPNAMVHHWRGGVFIPGVTLDEVLARVANPSPRDFEQEDVLDSRVLDRAPGSLRLFLRLQRSQVVTVVYDTEHAVRYTRHGRTRASSSSVATRIAEVTSPGAANERATPIGQDRGFLWRLNSYWRYEQIDGGVIVTCESISLSRAPPSLLAGALRPLIDHIARGSMERTLSAMRGRFGNEQRR